MEFEKIMKRLEFCVGPWSDYRLGDDVKELLSSQKAQIEELTEENSKLASWQCVFLDGSGLTGDDHGHQICLKALALDSVNRRLYKACCREEKIPPGVDQCEKCPRQWMITND